jgi:rhodanese-related sulfurtransferase
MVLTLTAVQLAAMVASQAVDVVDVRDADEWDAGHLDGARSVPLEQLRADPDVALRHGAPIVFVCAKGLRSLQAAKLAARFGYAQVYHLDGGTRAWVATGLALVSEQRAAA